jgi:hypothetical protein
LQYIDIIDIISNISIKCYDLGVHAHIPDLKKSHNDFKDIFNEDQFQYDSQTDTYLCPGGHHLKRSSYKRKQDAYEYRCSHKICHNCSLLTQCTKSKDCRTLVRHRRKDDLDKMRNAAQSSTAKRDIRTRQHLMERSFARATRYGFKRARFRRLWRVQIQEYLTLPSKTSWYFCRTGKIADWHKDVHYPLFKNCLQASIFYL